MCYMLQTIEVVANCSSILSLLISAIVFLRLRSIYKSFLLQARFPALRKKIAAHRTSLSKLLNDFPSTRLEVAAEIQRCLANLKSLRSKLSRSAKKNVREIIKSIERAISAKDKQYFDDVYLGLVQLEEELENLSEDNKWRSKE